MEADKFTVDVNEHLRKDIIQGVDVYDFRNQDREAEDDLKHCILLCKENAYFEKKKLRELDFKYSEDYFFSEQKPYSKIKVNLRKLMFIMQFLDGKFHGTLKRENIGFNVYKDYFEPVSENLIMWPMKYHKKYLYGKMISMKIDLLKKILQTKELLSCENILEYGCGSGVNLILLNRLYGEKRLSGFEYPAARYASALVNFEIHNVELNNFFLADGRDLPLRDDSFDLVFTCHVLEQLKADLSKALNEVIRIAKKGVVLMEPSNFKAKLSERLFLRYEQYCENLIDIIKDRNDVEVIEHSKCALRGWLLPSNFIVLRKTD